MKLFILACVVALAALAAADDLKIVDDFDYTALFKNEGKWKESLPCFLEQAPCGDMQALKDATAQRLRAKCGQCTPAQQEKYNRELKALKDTYPEDYEAIKKKYIGE